MRKVLLFACFICFAKLSVNAQLYVDQYGRTTVGYNGSYSGLFNVIKESTGTTSYSLVEMYTQSDFCALSAINYTPEEVLLNNTNSLYGISTGCENKSNRSNYGISIWSFRENALDNGRSYGIHSYAGRATDGWNFGVCTSLQGEHKGAGLYASSGNIPDGVNVNGRWAGYFDGNVKVVGNLSTSSYTTLSDYRLKDNIRQVDDGSLNKVKEMNVVKYRFKNLELDMGDTAQKVYYMYPEDSQILKKDHFGLIAQELKEIYPELVDEGEDGYLSVNYMELVPILIKSIQELSSKFDALENEAAKSIQRGDKNTMIGGLNLQAILYQNDPNPFTENTTIKCVIPNSVQNAVLYIYDMNGHQIDSRTIGGRGNASLTIEGSSLEAGMYLYSLITDGTVVDTKRMILTK